MTAKIELTKNIKDKKLLMTKAKSQILAKKAMIAIIGTSLIMPNSSFGSAMITHDPQTFAQSYAQFVESIEKYNNMIKTAQDTLDTMNRINDIMNTANNTLNNLQTGLADPRQLADRFKANIDSINDNANRIAKSLQERNWLNTFVEKEFASCKKKWQNLRKEIEAENKLRAEKRLAESVEKWEEGNDEAQAKLEEAAAAFNDAQMISEIDMGLKTIEYAYNGTATSISDKLNKWANEAQYYVDVGNIETKAKEHTNPYQIQTDICGKNGKLTQMKIKLKMDKAKNEYFKALAEGRNADARAAFKKWRQQGYEESKRRQQVKIDTRDKASKNFNRFKTSNNLVINKDSGELVKKEQWEKVKYIDNFPPAPAESFPVPITDKNGNTTTQTVWVAKRDTIQALFNNGNIYDALNLQNQRNMAIAMQGDTQAIQRSQLETAELLGQQINELNISINELGNVINAFLQEKIDIQQDALNNLGDNNTPYDIHNTEKKLGQSLSQTMQKHGLGEFDDILIGDEQSGRIKFKDEKKESIIE